MQVEWAETKEVTYIDLCLCRQWRANNDRIRTIQDLWCRRPRNPQLQQKHSGKGFRPDTAENTKDRECLVYIIAAGGCLRRCLQSSWRGKFRLWPHSIQEWPIQRCSLRPAALQTAGCPPAAGGHQHQSNANCHDQLKLICLLGIPTAGLRWGHGSKLWRVLIASMNKRGGNNLLTASPQIVGSRQYCVPLTIEWLAPDSPPALSKPNLGEFHGATWTTLNARNFRTINMDKNTGNARTADPHALGYGPRSPSTARHSMKL